MHEQTMQKVRKCMEIKALEYIQGNCITSNFKYLEEGLKCSEAD